MSSRAQSRPGKPATGKKKKAPRAPGWTRWWPVILGLVMTPFALKTAEILPLMGAGGLTRLRLLYPFAMLLQQHELGLSASVGENLSRGMLYAQFPLYGLYVLAITRWRTLRTALMQVLALHLLAFAVVWLLAQK